MKRLELETKRGLCVKNPDFCLSSWWEASPNGNSLARFGPTAGRDHLVELHRGEDKQEP